MRPSHLLVFLLAFIGTTAQDRFGFRALERPDTLSAEAFAQLQLTHDLVHAVDHRITLATEAGEERHAGLVRPWGQRWLVYPLANGSNREGYTLEGFTEDGRFLRMRTWSANVVRGHENHTAELQLVDLERAVYVAIPTSVYERTWQPIAETDSTRYHTSLDTAVVDISAQLVTIRNGCSVDGRPAPCTHPGGLYVFTPEGLVREEAMAASDAAASAVTAEPATPPLPLRETDVFPFQAADRLCPMYYGPNAGLWPMNAEDRARFLQQEAARYAHDELFLFAQLPAAMGPRITILCSNNDAYDLLWVSYDASGRLNGLDTLASLYGDGQEHTEECAAYDPHGMLTVRVINKETLRDEADTMAYALDTLVYEVRVEAVGILGEEQGETRYRYGLQRLPLDLTARWVECNGADDKGPYRWRSLKDLIPTDRRVFQQASGDLDRDGRTDHVLVLTNADDDGDRDLLIVFTSPDACGFVQQAFLPGFLPSRGSGGFHDPIGEEGLSGISIQGDSLVVHLFGGSAWKWEEHSVYRYAPTLNDFYLVRQESRSYHAPSVSNLQEDLRYFEELSASRPLTAEEKEELAKVRKTEEAYRWKGTTYALGQKPMRK
ncbi:MAG: hypothetical protein JNM91_04005 [Flavobacteriales bacterium]|nr:hypothetical protein [Flavobacteriales bacterium]